MKFALFVLIAFCSLQGFGMHRMDTTWNQTDEMGMKQGYWKKSYPNGELMYKGFFRNNKPAGKMLRYYEDGSLQAELVFHENTNVTYATMYFNNGQAGAIGKYISQKRDSIWSFYSYYTGTLSYQENYSMGKKHGVSIVYYAEGAVAEKTWWQDGMKQGKWEQFFEDSTLRLSSAYQPKKPAIKYETVQTNQLDLF